MTSLWAKFSLCGQHRYLYFYADYWNFCPDNYSHGLGNYLFQCLHFFLGVHWIKKSQWVKWSEKEEKGIFVWHLKRRKGTLGAAVGKTMLTKFHLKLGFSHGANLGNGWCVTMLSFWGWWVETPVSWSCCLFLSRQCL